jgi:hypothetical protein
LLLLLQSCDVLLRAESLILGRHTLNRQFVWGRRHWLLGILLLGTEGRLVVAGLLL